MKNSPSYQAWCFTAPTVHMRSLSLLWRGFWGLIFTGLSQSHGTAMLAEGCPGCRKQGKREVLIARLCILLPGGFAILWRDFVFHCCSAGSATHFSCWLTETAFS